MHKTTRTAILLALPALLFLGADTPASGAVAVRPDVVVHGGAPAEIALVGWAVARYERAGLELPPLEVYFHEDTSGCRGRLGFYEGGRVELCLGLILNLVPRQTILHEMAHAWGERALTDVLRARFMELRHVDTWASWDEPWPERGWEQAAEIVAWGVGDRVLTPVIPDNSPEDVRTAYELLTGSPPPE